MHQPMIVLTAGRFGAQVGKRLAQLRGAKVADLPHDSDTLQTLVAEADFVAVATWRPFVTSCQLLDDLCFQQQVPWSLAEIHAQRLTCGPLVRPGSGACYHCYRKRWLSHHKAPERELALEQAYQRDPDLGPPGFTGPMVEIAAQALAADAVGDTEPGKLRVVDVLSGVVLESEVIGIHECPRCRPCQYTRPGERFVKTLVPEIARILG